MRTSSLNCLAVIALCCAGCATAVAGSEPPVSRASRDDGVDVRVELHEDRICHAIEIYTELGIEVSEYRLTASIASGYGVVGAIESVGMSGALAVDAGPGTHEIRLPCFRTTVSLRNPLCVESMVEFRTDTEGEARVYRSRQCWWTVREIDDGTPSESTDVTEEQQPSVPTLGETGSP